MGKVLLEEFFYKYKYSKQNSTKKNRNKKVNELKGICLKTNKNMHTNLKSIKIFEAINI